MVLLCMRAQGSMREAIGADEQAWSQVMDATESESPHEELWLGEQQMLVHVQKVFGTTITSRFN